MTDAHRGEAPIATAAASVRRWRPSALLLIVGGAIAMIVGGIVESAAKAPVDSVTLFHSAMMTLPVGVYRQYTQAAGGGIELTVVPDYWGLWIGAIVALVGVIGLLAGVVLATTKRHTA